MDPNNAAYERAQKVERLRVKVWRGMFLPLQRATSLESREPGDPGKMDALEAAQALADMGEKP